MTSTPALALVVPLLCALFFEAAAGAAPEAVEAAACGEAGDECPVFEADAEEAEPARVSLLQTDLRFASSRHTLAQAALQAAGAESAANSTVAADGAEGLRGNMTELNVTLLAEAIEAQAARANMSEADVSLLAEIITERPESPRWISQTKDGACPLLYFATVDGGCCPPATISTGRKKCVSINCPNILMYACEMNNITEKPHCEDHHNWFSNKAIDRRCTLGEHRCRYIKYDWATRHIPILNIKKRAKFQHDCHWPSEEQPVVGPVNIPPINITLPPVVVR